MKRNTRLYYAVLAGLVAIRLMLVTGGFSHVALGQEPPTPATLKKAAERKPDYSPYPDQKFPTRVFWGDTHHHSSFSCDAGLMGCTLDPETSFRFARGEEVISNSGQRAYRSKSRQSLRVSNDRSENRFHPQSQR